MSNYTRFGKNLAHWFYNVSSDIYSSVPPTLDDIQTESGKVQFFVNSFSFTTQGSSTIKIEAYP